MLKLRNPNLNCALTSWALRRAARRWDTPVVTIFSGPRQWSPCTCWWRSGGRVCQGWSRRCLLVGTSSEAGCGARRACSPSWWWSPCSRRSLTPCHSCRVCSAAAGCSGSPAAAWCRGSVGTPPPAGSSAGSGAGRPRWRRAGTAPPGPPSCCWTRSWAGRAGGSMAAVSHWRSCCHTGLTSSWVAVTVWPWGAWCRADSRQRTDARAGAGAELWPSSGRGGANQRTRPPPSTPLYSIHYIYTTY